MMADKDEFNEEYQFAELDPLNPDAMNEETKTAHDDADVSSQANGNPIKRNAAIAVGIFLLVVTIYKFMGARLEEKPIDVSKAPVSLSTPSIAQPIEAAPETVLPSAPADNSQVTPNELQVKLSNMEMGQESIKSDLNGVTTQVNTMNATVDSLSGKLDGLMTTITTLNERLESQSRLIQQLTAKKVAAVRQHTLKSFTPPIRFYIQAVIPGRAWLVATNGRTLTVREGSTIPGYGTVKLIDPSQGRILTSSGQQIRFSQDDS